MLLELPLAPDGLDDEELPPALDGLELMPLEPWLELEPLAPLAECAASHSERLICPSWFLSILSNSASREDEPPEALLPEDDELEPDVPPAEDDVEGEDDDLLPCDMDGEDEEPELLFESPAAYAAAAKARSEKLRNTGLMNFMQCLLVDKYRSRVSGVGGQAAVVSKQQACRAA